ncbi:MAG: clostripain-related cysteine peptidase, partial [Myxococcaceae bacterium]
MPVRNWLWVGVLAAAVAASGCGEEGGPPGGGTGHGNPGRSWTFLVYMVGDNNLEPFALADLAEMAQPGSTDAVHLVAQLDRAAGYSADSLGNLPDFTSTKRILVEQGSFTELSDLGELNMGDPRSLQDFIEWGIKAYPADRTALIFWDHGGSWPGFGGDESHAGDVLSIPELKQAIQAGMSTTGQTQFALIGYDACLMSTVEVALAMRPFGEYLLASEELEPGHGWDYRDLALITTDSTTAPDALGRKLVEGFAAQAAQAGTGANITLSLTDLYALDDVAAGLDTLNREFTSKMGEFDTLLGRQRAASLSFGESPDPRQSMNMVDLGDFIGRLAGADNRFAAVRTQIQAGLQKAVIAKTSGPLTNAATGLALYFPSSQAAYAASYDGIAEAASWRGFLKAFIGGGASEGKPVFTNPNNIAGAALGTGGLSLQGDLAAGASESISTAVLTYGIRDVATSTTLILGEQPAAWSSTAVTGTWDLSILVLSQGTNEGFGYLQLGVT